MRCRIRSLAPTNFLNRPFTTTLMVAGTSTFSTLQRPDTRHLGGADAERERAERAMTGRVGVGTHHHRARSNVAVFGQDLVADAADIAADVVELADTCAATNSRTFFWFVAVFGDSAGTRWSKMIATRDGSQICGGPRALVDLQKLVDHQRGVLVRHGEVHAAARPRPRRTRTAGRPRAPGSSQQRSSHGERMRSSVRHELSHGCPNWRQGPFSPSAPFANQMMPTARRRDASSPFSCSKRRRLIPNATSDAIARFVRSTIQAFSQGSPTSSAIPQLARAVPGGAAVAGITAPGVFSNMAVRPNSRSSPRPSTATSSKVSRCRTCG